MRRIVGDDVSLEQLAGGFEFIEGPVWHPREDFLIFSDIVGDRMLRWSADQGISTFRMPSGMANGNAYDQSGRLITCEHATSRVSQTDLNGAITTLADRYEGYSLNSPNDVVVKTDGSIYFTDPTFGRNEYYGIPRDSELSFRGVYRIDSTGKLSLLVDDFAQPNGLCFSLDERLLFVNDTERMHIRVFPLLPNGLLGDGSVWGVTEGDGEGAPDGMKIDSEGNLYCCGQGGIHVFDPEAVCLGVIRTPEVSANFTWGDEDLRSFFICASTGLYRIRVKIPGVPSF
jgi:gluconolactonase